MVCWFLVVRAEWNGMSQHTIISSLNLVGKYGNDSMMSRISSLKFPQAIFLDMEVDKYLLLWDVTRVLALIKLETRVLYPFKRPAVVSSRDKTKCWVKDFFVINSCVTAWNVYLEQICSFSASLGRSILFQSPHPVGSLQLLVWNKAVSWCLGSLALVSSFPICNSSFWKILLISKVYAWLYNFLRNSNGFSLLS